MSALDYARWHGLAIDHTAENLLTSISQLTYTLTELEAKLPDPDFSLISSELTEPKLQLSHQGGALLSASIRASHPTIVWNSVFPEPHRLSKFKLDEPLLAGDHETDVRRFRREASSFKDGEILLDSCSPITSDADQYLEDEWNDIASGNAVRKVEQELQDERCHTTKGALLHLSDSLKNKLTDELRADTLQTFLPPFKRARVRSLTPPLMLADESPEPYVPSTSELEFPLRSDEVIDSDDLLLRVGREMAEKDHSKSDEAPGINVVEARKLFQAARSLPDNALGLGSPTEMMISTHAERRRQRRELESLKLDVPFLSSASLFDPDSEDTSAGPDVDQVRWSSSKPEQAFLATSAARMDLVAPPSRGHGVQRPLDFDFAHDRSSTLHDLLRDEAMKLEDDLSVSQLDDAFDEFDEELFRLADSAKTNLDTELDEAKADLPETCLKIPVPQLEKVAIRAPWETRDTETLRRQLDELFLIATSPSDVQEEMQMNWQAIPSRLMKVSIDDSIEDDGQSRKWVGIPQVVTKSEQMLFKRPGLRLLDAGDDSDDEIEEDLELAQDFSKPVVPTVPTKRVGHELLGLDPAFDLKVNKPRAMNDDDMHDILGTKHSLEKPLPAASTSNALESFLDLRGGKFKRVQVVPQHAADELEDDPIQATQSEKTVEGNTPQTAGSRLLRELCESTTAAVQVPATPGQEISKDEMPTLKRLAWPRTVVIETAILQRHRSLINFLENTGGDQVKIVYRELARVGRNKSTRASPDMILSPTTALLFTSIQALNQKTLPTQSVAGRSMVQSRVLQVAQDYDRIFIVITTTTTPAGSWTRAQTDMMTAFAGFAASLSSNDDLTVVPVWVTSKPDPQLTDSAINGCVWDMICRYGYPDTNPAASQTQDIDTVVIIDSETLWEQFLRTLGLNPMAAQIVVGALRRYEPGEGSHSPSQDWGLRRFVQMHGEERRDMFGAILGSRTVERVNRMIDERWG